MSAVFLSSLTSMPSCQRRLLCNSRAPRPLPARRPPPPCPRLPPRSTSSSSLRPLTRPLCALPASPPPRQSRQPAPHCPVIRVHALRLVLRQEPASGRPAGVAARARENFRDAGIRGVVGPGSVCRCAISPPRRAPYLHHWQRPRDSRCVLLRVSLSLGHPLP